MTELRYFVLGPIAGTPYVRYGILHGEHTVWEVQISRPDGLEVERPAHLRWRRADGQDVRIRTWRINEPPVGVAGQQPRRPVWKRAGRTASNVEAA